MSDSSAWPRVETRAHNRANELESITITRDDKPEEPPVVVVPAHDQAGNMTKVPRPDDWDVLYDLTYDAWNRLVKVSAGEQTVAEYEYDGLNRRIVKVVYGALPHKEHFYYNEGWQVVEVRKDETSRPSGPLCVAPVLH